MSLRILALYIFVGIFVVYAWKDWFKSLCGLILLAGVIKHEDMPRTWLDIPGLNPWNVLLVVILFAWLVSRRREEAKWDMPRHINILLLLYLGVILSGVLRAVFDLGLLVEYTRMDLIIEGTFNTLKWVIPGILIFDGCRTRKSVIMVIVCLLGMYFLIAVQVVRRLPPQVILDVGSNLNRAQRACHDIGYSAVDMSVFLAGAFWAIIATLPLIRQKKYKIPVLGAAGIVVFGQALTGGRAGYIAWVATGLVLCVLKWRKYLLLAPVVLILVPLIFPGVVDRMSTGFGEIDYAGENITNDYAVTSGRIILWPYVIDKISQSPLVGYGRLAMQRTGLTNQLISDLNEGFGHPHNMYLETLLDNGILGSIPIFVFWGILLLYIGRLFKSDNRLCSAVGGMALAMMLTQLFAGIGSQHFYPEESTLGVWAAMFLAMRVYLEQEHSQISIAATESYEDEESMQPQTPVTAIHT
jgi:O-antigen ligase